MTCYTDSDLLQYPQGVMDPIEALSEIALRHRLPLHVDACVGGFLLPWVKKLGFMDEKFDYELPAVTSISLDVHKVSLSSFLSLSVSFTHSLSLQTCCLSFYRSTSLL